MLPDERRVLIECNKECHEVDATESSKQHDSCQPIRSWLQTLIAIIRMEEFLETIKQKSSHLADRSENILK